MPSLYCSKNHSLSFLYSKHFAFLFSCFIVKVQFLLYINLTYILHNRNIIDLVVIHVDDIPGFSTQIALGYFYFTKKQCDIFIFIVFYRFMYFYLYIHCNFDITEFVSWIVSFQLNQSPLTETTCIYCIFLSQI